MKKILLFTFALLTGTCGFTQYTLTAFSADYQPLVNGTTPNGVFAEWDDPLFAVPLGFEFTMGNTTFNSVTQQGLGATFIGGSFNNGAIFSYLSDIIDAGQVPEEVPSEITYTVSGNVGNQICKIQFANAAFYSEVSNLNSAENRTNFQMWFYESDFSLEIRFGASNITNAPLVYEGIDGPGIGVFTGITDDGENAEYGAILTGNPANPVLETVDIEDDIFAIGLDATPANGQVYRFAPTIVSTDDLENQIQFSVFPNPTVNHLRIDGDISENTTYRISDVTGKIVLSGRYNSRSTIDVSNLSSGIYILTMDGYAVSEKFVKN